MIKCQICKELLRHITASHLKKHNITVREYKKKFNVKHLVCKKSRRKISKKMEGNKNTFGKKWVLSDEFRENRRKRALGRKQEWKEMMKRINKGNDYALGYIFTEEQRENCSIAKQGNQNALGNRFKQTEEVKEKMSERMSGENNPNWKGGISCEPYSPNFNQQLKDRVRVRDNFICQLCGLPELECSRRFNVHHIDYDKNNSRIDNLILLCCSCHIKTNNEREYWKGCFISDMILRR